MTNNNTTTKTTSSNNWWEETIQHILNHQKGINKDNVMFYYYDGNFHGLISAKKQRNQELKQLLKLIKDDHNSRDFIIKKIEEMI